MIHYKYVMIIHWDQPIKRIYVKPKEKYTADFIFDIYTINLDLKRACCEAYDIYVNGKTYKGTKDIQIKPSKYAEITFGEKCYHYKENSHLQKNYMLILFESGDRIRVVRSEQSCGDYDHIYTRGVYLEYDNKSEFIGIV